MDVTYNIALTKHVQPDGHINCRSRRSTNQYVLFSQTNTSLPPFCSVSGSAMFRFYIIWISNQHTVLT